MKRTQRTLAFVVSAAAVVACAGGPGSLSERDEGWESRAGDREAPASSASPIDPERRRTEELAPPTVEGRSDTQLDPPPTRFACEGIYICTVTYRGRSESGPVVFRPKPDGTCAIGAIVLEEDRTLTTIDNGRRVSLGSWKGGDGAIVLTLADAIVTCNRYNGTDVIRDIGQRGIETQVDPPNGNDNGDGTGSGALDGGR